MSLANPRAIGLFFSEPLRRGRSNYAYDLSEFKVSYDTYCS